MFIPFRFRDVQAGPYSARGASARDFIRQIFAAGDANRRGYRRKYPDLMLHESMSLELHGGLITAHSEAFAAGKYKAADDWIG